MEDIIHHIQPQLKTSIYTPNYMYKEPITTLSETNRF